MKTPLSIALLAAGLASLAWGINASETFSSQVHEFFAGTPSETALALIIGGTAASALGLAGLLMRSKKTKSR